MIFKFKKSKNILECSIRICVIFLASVLMVMGISHARGEIHETNIYQLRLMIQTFDGAKEFSHTQTAGIARMRKGNESYVLMDFHNGAVVIERPDRTSLGNFKNTSGAEAEFKYNYETNTLSGHNGAAKYFNEYVRPLLTDDLKPGVDAKWTQEMSLAQLGATVSPSRRLSIKLERKYFSHDGMDFILIHYQIPAFSYDLNNGTPVIHWGQGVALADPGFGIIYWNASLQRAVAQMPGEAMSRPYRFAKTLAAVDERGVPLIDPRKIKEVAPYFKDFYGSAKIQILPFQGDNSSVEQTPIVLAADLDVMALSLAENSANQLGEVSGQIYGGNNGAESGGYLDAAVEGYGIPDKFLAAFSGLAEMGDDELKSLATSFETYTNQVAYDARVAKTKTGLLSIRLKQTSADIRRLKQIMQTQIAEAKTVDQLFNGPAARTMDRLTEVTKKSQQLVGELNALNKDLGNLVAIKQQLPMLQKAQEALVSSGAIKFAQGLGDALKRIDGPLSFLGGLGNMAEVYETATNLGEFNPADTDLKLTGKYNSSSEFAMDIALNVMGIAGNAASGNIAATVTDVLTFASGRYVDLYKVYQAAKHADRQSDQAHMDLILTMKRAVVQAEEYAKRDMEAMKAGYQSIYTDEDPYANGYDIYHPNWDPEKGQWKEGTRQWSAEQAARKNIESKVSSRDANQPSADDWAEFNKKISEIRDPYPKGPKYIPKVKPDEPEKQKLNIPDWFTKIWDELPAEIRKLKLDRYQAEILKQRKEEQELREAERTDRIKNGGLWDDPVVFDPVVWEMPVWEPPVWDPPSWVPPEFEAPVGTIIDFTQFSGSEDPNWLGFAYLMAYQYESLSGTVETDLSQWAEWLATQDIRKLTQLALQAGYPNLASALADWKNLTRNAADDGYRKWAMAPPSCGGYIGCGPNYLGRWTMKKSQLLLGDILADSRDIFSTAGLSDVAISGFLLNYLLRDFGLEDGDIVDVVIKQFGRIISKTQLSLLNDGTDFRIALRPGVASVEITAVNEGAISPNTAQIRIENVKEGDAVQSYSLLTGEVAVLRVEPGR